MKLTALILLLTVFEMPAVADDVDTWIHDLEDESMAVRMSAALALGDLRDTRAVEPLIQALKDEDSLVRGSAASALGYLRDSRAVEPLIQALEDDDQNVRRSAAEALVEFNNFSGIEILIQALKDKDSFVRSKASKALGKFNDTRAVEPLIQALEDESSFVRVDAARINFERIDKHASNAPESQKKSINSLASYLISPTENDIEKIRAIYYWITHNINYNIGGLLSGYYGDISPEGVLKSGQSVCSGYSGLFDRLTRAAGLEVVTINGYAKGYDYVPGMVFTGPTNHAWNAVRLNGTWYLLDSTWGAGYVNGRKFVRKFDEHYFLTPPEEFIYDHFPEDPKWQLLDKPITIGDFENFVYLKPDFYNLGLRLGNQINGTINCSQATHITLYTPLDVFLMAILVHNGQDFPKIERKGDIYDIHVDLPAPGDYVLQIFGRQGDEVGDYTEVMEYKIVSKA